jgi:hypothetical protein
MDSERFHTAFMPIQFKSWFEIGREVVIAFRVFPDSDRAIKARRYNLCRRKELGRFDTGGMATQAL